MKYMLDICRRSTAYL